MVRIVCLSDTHNMLHRVAVPDGDVLVHAGDMTGTGRAMEINAELEKLIALPHKHIIFIAGNHDWLYEKNPLYAADIVRGFNERSGGRLHYLQDESVTIDGVKFYGSPWQPEFCGWAFNLGRDSEDMRRVWKEIPDDTDVLITHGPPYNILDLPGMRYRFDADGKPRHVGCEVLAPEVAFRVKPQLHVFGHVHGSYGQQCEHGVIYVNAATCDEGYDTTNPPIIIDLE